MKACPGHPCPLGATWDGAGVDFSPFSEPAEPVDLCLSGGTDGEEAELTTVSMQTDRAWHVYVPDVRHPMLWSAPLAGGRVTGDPMSIAEAADPPGGGWRSP